MPTFALALGLATALAGGTAGPAGPDGFPDGGLLIRAQAVVVPTVPVPATPASPAPALSSAPAAVPPTTAPVEAAMPFAQGALPGQAPPAPSVVYQAPPGQALSDPAIEARINAQIQTLLVPPAGGFTVQRYARPDTGSAGGGIGSGSSGVQNPPAGPSTLRAGNGYGGAPGTGDGTSGGGASGRAGPMQQAGYPNVGPGGGAGFPQSGGQGSGQAGGPFGGNPGQGGFQGQGSGAYPSQANFQAQGGGYPGQGGYGQGGFPGQSGAQGGYPGQGGYGQAGYGQGGYPGGGFGQNGYGGYGPPPVKRYAVARAGDTVYATLDQGYNSDDPQAPIFATIYDVDSAQAPGPLNGVRLIGQIVYSSNQAAIQFTQMVLIDGRQFPLKAYAISARDARTGISNDVDEHTFERYAGLFAAALIQGAGQAGQLLLQTNRNVVIDPTTGFAVSQPGSGVRTQAALAALLPLGQAATAVAAQNFNKPATIAGVPGNGIGVVFLEPPALPRDALHGGYGVYRESTVISRLN